MNTNNDKENGEQVSGVVTKTDRLDKATTEMTGTAADSLPEAVGEGPNGTRTTSGWTVYADADFSTPNSTSGWIAFLRGPNEAAGTPLIMKNARDAWETL